MVSGAAKLLAGACAAALLTAPVALAQSAEPEAELFVLRGVPAASVQPIEGAVEIQPLVQQPDVSGESEADAEPATPSLAPMEPASGSSLPWYERFTVSTPSEYHSAWGEEATEFSFTAGERWGFTLGIAEQEHGPQQFELEDVRAGAFYELSNRFRVGTNLRFSSPAADVFGQEGEDSVPELKFESAFRF